MSALLITNSFTMSRWVMKHADRTEKQENCRISPVGMGKKKYVDVLECYTLLQGINWNEKQR
jgi:hypothetical protein